MDKELKYDHDKFIGFVSKQHFLNQFNSIISILPNTKNYYVYSMYCHGTGSIEGGFSPKQWSYQ